MQRWPYLLISSLFLSGCISQSPIYPPLPKLDPAPAPAVAKPATKKVKHAAVPKPPKKVHELKEVQDQNFDPDYMYPTTPAKKRTPPKVDTPAKNTPAAATTTMGRDECIAMLGQAKFDKYTQMLGSESAAIKRCVMMQSMK